jgi:hypothetical protein
MEILYPSLIVVLLTVAFAFFIMPRYAPITLVMASAVALVLAGYKHWYEFKTEYTNSTWQNNLRRYAALVIVGVVILMTWLYKMFNTAPAPAPMIGLPQMGGGLSELFNTASSRFRDLMTKGRIRMH